MKRLAIALLITGCSNGPIVNVEVPQNVEASVYKKFIGVPVLLAVEGSYVRINEDWILTAAHNWPLFPIHKMIKHPDCDIALVNMKGSGGLDDALVYPNGRVFHSGYPLGSGFTSTAGNYLGDVFVKGYPNCQMSASTGAIAGGMSGGAVTNEDGELVGIIHGFANHSIKWPHESHYKPVIWTSINYVQDWIAKTIFDSGKFKLTDKE